MVNNLFFGLFEGWNFKLHVSFADNFLSLNDFDNEKDCTTGITSPPTIATKKDVS